MKLIKSLFLILLSIFLSISPVYSQPSSSTAPGLFVQEEDGSPSSRYRRLKFANGTLTDNSDGSISISVSGGASQLSDLTDVGVTTPTDKNALMADGDSWESRALVADDIPDLSGVYEPLLGFTPLAIDGSNANSNIDISTYDFITTGTLGAGAITGTSFTDGTATLSGGALSNATGLISQWTNDESYITTTSLTGLVPYTGATTDVDLGSKNITTTGTLAVDSPTLVVNATGYTNKVGIGTATPSAKLEVNSTVWNSHVDTDALVVKFPTSTAGTIGAVRFGKMGAYNEAVGFKFQQVSGTDRLLFRGSAAAGAVVWSQPETGARLFIDIPTRSYIFSDTELWINNKISFTQTDGNEYIDSLNDGYVDIGATTGIRLNQSVTIPTTNHFTLGTTQWDNGSDKIDGQQIATGTLIDDTKGNGDTGYTWSADKSFDQFALKAPLTAPTFATSITGSYLTASEILITDGSKNIVSAPVATYPSLTELSYVKGVTSAIQTQLNGKQATLTNSAGLKSALSDESGTGVAIFAGGNIAAGTATTAAANDNDTSIATTEFVQQEINGAGGRSLSCSSGSCDADSELYTDTKCIYWEDPTADDDFKSLWTANGFGATITKIWCESDQTVNLDLQVDDGTPADVNGTDLVCDATPAEDESMGGDATIADGDRLDLAVTSVSGTPTWCSLCWTYTKDD